MRSPVLNTWVVPLSCYNPAKMKSSFSAIARFLSCFVFLLFYNQILTAQAAIYPCAASEMQRLLFDQDPALLQRQMGLDQKLHEHIQRQDKLGELRNAAVFTIPVVVHIVHENGTENISDLQVQAAIQHLNDAFAHQGYYATKGGGSTIPIQFCLAQRDPKNQATNGITRDVSPLTTMNLEKDDRALKQISPWDAKQYVNIWVVRDINSISHGSGVAGYAYYASAHGLSIDGIVCEARYFGNSPANDIVLIHEIGHYLNLYHTFEGGCSNNNCELEGDRVCDTPPDQAKHTGCLYNSCTTDADDPRPVNPLKTDGNDQTENYMDYSPFSCQHAFTPGQATRMLAALQTVRASLLDSPGCYPPCSQSIVADIAVPAKMVIGTPVPFTFGGSGATQFTWSLNGNSFSTQQNPSYTFTQVGTYKLEVVARNNDANCWARKEVSIKVECDASADFSPRLAEVQEGDQLVFTSTGSGINNYEWSINDTVVGTNKTYTHLFDKPGSYQLRLKVSNSNCSAVAIQNILVKSPCGDFVQQYSYEYNLPRTTQFVKRSENGELFGGGNGNQEQTQAVLMKWNANEELEWIKRETNVSPGWLVWDVVPLSDGSWVYTKKNNSTRNLIELTKINPQGDLIWNRRFKLESDQNPHNQLISLKGTNEFILHDHQTLIKFDESGNVAWSKIWKFGRIGGAVQRPDGKLLVIANELPAKIFLLLMDDMGTILKQVVLSWIDEWTPTMSINALSDNGGIVLIKGRNKSNILQIDANLATVWGKEIPSDASIAPTLISKNDDVFLTYTGNNISNGIAFDKKGNHLWTVKLPRLTIKSELLGVPYLDGWKIIVTDTLYDAPTRDFHLKIPNTQFPQGCFLNQSASVPIQDFMPSVSAGTFRLDNFSIEAIAAPGVVYESLQATRHEECRIQIVDSCPEICDNDIDDNGDGLVDCADPTCKCEECRQLPDGIISTVDSIQCLGDSLKVYLKICNQGQGLLRATTPIAFYQTDPTVSNANPLAGVKTIGVHISPGACIVQHFVIKAPGTNPIFVVLNDDYRRPRPYTLERFLVERHPECNYLNNKFQFNYNPPQVPQLSLGADQLVCSNSVTVLRASPGFSRYRWQDGTSDSTLTAFSPGLYWLDAWDACGNLQSDSIRLTLQPLGEVDLGADRSICVGDTVQLSIAGFTQVNWWPVQGLSCDTCRNIVVKPDTTTQYYVTARQGNCFAGDSLLIVVNHQPKITLELPDTLTCAQNQVQLGLTSTDTRAKIEWYDTKGQILNGSSPRVDAPGWYTVSVIDSSGLCTVQDSVQVTQNISALKVDLGPDQSPCNDSTVQIRGPILAGLTYQWNTGASTPAIAVSQSGTYVLQISDGTGCTGRDTLNVQFSTLFRFDLGADTVICTDKVLRLPLQAIDADQYRWSTGAQTAFIEVQDPGLYVLEGIRDNCSWRDSIRVELEDCSQFAVYVPNVMSPTSTVNQRFHPFFDQKTEILSYQFDIYDRWGEIVFRSVDQQESWDGSKRGEKCQQGVYVWTLRLRYRENEQEKEAFKVGEVLLLR